MCNFIKLAQIKKATRGLCHWSLFPSGPVNGHSAWFTSCLCKSCLSAIVSVHFKACYVLMTSLFIVWWCNDSTIQQWYKLYDTKLNKINKKFFWPKLGKTLPFLLQQGRKSLLYTFSFSLSLGEKRDDFSSSQDGSLLKCFYFWGTTFLKVIWEVWCAHSDNLVLI